VIPNAIGLSLASICLLCFVLGCISNEYILKEETSSLPIQNMSLAAMAMLVVSLKIAYQQQLPDFQQFGMFQVLIALSIALLGLCVNSVLKYCNSVVMNYCTSIAMTFTCVLLSFSQSSLNGLLVVLIAMFLFKYDEIFEKG